MNNQLTIFISIIAVIISFMSYLSTVKSQNRLEKLRLEKDEKVQAINISTWITNEFTTKVIHQEKLDYNQKYTTAIINNDNSAPIYNVFGLVESNNNGNTIDNFINSTSRGSLQYDYFEILKPGVTKYRFEDYGQAMGNEHQVSSILFTDYNNIEWCRHSNGVLEKRKYVQNLQKKGILLKHV